VFAFRQNLTAHCLFLAELKSPPYIMQGAMGPACCDHELCRCTGDVTNVWETNYFTLIMNSVAQPYTLHTPLNELCCPKPYHTPLNELKALLGKQTVGIWMDGGRIPCGYGALPSLSASTPLLPMMDGGRIPCGYGALPSLSANTP
jgi:hypothetical protein